MCDPNSVGGNATTEKDILCRDTTALNIGINMLLLLVIAT